MSKVAIVTDSNSGITQALAKEMGIYVLPMPFMIDGREYYEDINLTADEFFEKLGTDVDISTSQPSLGGVTSLWDKLLKEYDEIVHIPMSSGLSGSCHTAFMLAQDYDGKIQVVDNQRISVTLRRAVDDALKMAEDGKSAEEIKGFLEETKLEASIYITLDTLKYLKKGGRLTPAAALIGEILRIKPVLQIQGDKLDGFSKARTIKSAKETMIKAVRNDMESRLGNDVYIDIAHTDNYEEAVRFKEQVIAAFPEIKAEDIRINGLSLSVSCHIGEGAIAIACTKKV